jgi:hypothetical protein
MSWEPETRERPASSIRVNGRNPTGRHAPPTHVFADGACSTGAFIVIAVDSRDSARPHTLMGVPNS